jgi:hypothetical protein
MIYDRAFSEVKKVLYDNNPGKSWVTTHLYVRPNIDMSLHFTDEEVAGLGNMLRGGNIVNTSGSMDQYVFPTYPENLAVLAVMGIGVVPTLMQTNWEVSDGDT